MLLVSELLLL